MSFVYPAFLWALGALSIPVIVHLFSFRRYKIIYFPNVSFLQEVKKESDSRTRIKHWLVLASRLLALAFIIFAFAQPVLNNKNPELKKGKKAVSIYIDNSFSMQSHQNDVSVLETAKAKAREIISAYAPDDDFQIMTNTLEGI
ncbi:MAG: BatA domain-containing protein, partial [Bacteroidota bacterium]